MLLRFSLCLSTFLCMTFSAMADVDVKVEGNHAVISIGGEVFTEYHAGDSHAYYWPLTAPGGAKLTRSWPMADEPGEEHDHPHHRSMWFGHGNVNGHDFWAEKDSPIPLGKIIHKEFFSKVRGPAFGELGSRQEWVTDKGTILHSTQTLHIYPGDENARWIDWEIKLTGVGQPVVFGDTKEGTFALRVAESMRHKLPAGPGKGNLLNSAGDADGAVWGKRAKWVALSGPVGDTEYTIVFVDHPENLNHPTRWHARDYGLFAANPFCEAEMNPEAAKGAGGYTMSAGGNLTFKYRIVMARGKISADVINRHYSDYLKSSK